MSSPPNPLDDYRTYSYHHILAVANNTEAIRLFIENPEMLTNINTLSPGQEINLSGNAAIKAPMVLLINSQRESKYFITDLNFHTNMMGPSEATNSSIATKLNMVVRETGGISFMNMLERVSNEVLFTTFSGAIYLLKTIFVGHTYAGEVVTINNVMPMTLMLMDMSASFDETGGIYTFSFADVCNGAPLHQEQMLHINRDMNLKTEDKKLVDLIKHFEQKLNNALKAEKDKAGEMGRLVQYQFTWPDKWNSFTVDSVNVENFVEQTFTKEANKTTKNENTAIDQPDKKNNAASKTYINFPVNMSVTNILSTIFKHCPEIAARAKVNSKVSQHDRQNAIFHKVVSTITSDDAQVTVHFDIMDFHLPKLPNKIDVTDKLTSTEEYAKVDNELSKYGIVFDYMFSGKNTDILSFDMKIPNALIYIQRNEAMTAGATNHTGAGLTDKIISPASAPNENRTADNTTESLVAYIRKKDPIYLPSMTHDAQQGYTYASKDMVIARQDYQKALSRFSSNGLLSIRLKIRGNPNLFNNTIRGLLPHDSKQYATKMKEMRDAADTISTKPNANLMDKKDVDVSSFPTFVKVNIFSPAEEGSDKFSEPFWYDGWFYLFNVEHRFSNGVFEQELILNAYSVYGTSYEEQQIIDQKTLADRKVNGQK